MKKVAVLFLIMLIAQAGESQVIVSGRIKDADTKLPLRFSSIFSMLTGTGVRSGEAGEFSIAMPDSNPGYRIIISSSGYISDTVHTGGLLLPMIIYLKPARGVLNEVVITGVTRATLIRENPVAITVVPARKIDAAVEANIIDVLVKNVPGINAVKTGPNVSKPFIRGLGYNRVLTLYDGIRQEGQQWGDEHGLEVDAYNIEKAEVIKGPASLMFGSDALAGVVSLFPAMPKETDAIIHGRLLSEYQGNNGLAGNGFRIAQHNKNWLWTISGSFRLAKNYSNRVDGRVYNTGFRETNGAAMIGYSSAKGYTYLTATMYNNLQGIPDGSRDSSGRKFTRQVLEGAADDVTGRPIVAGAVLNSYALSPLHQHIQHYRVYTNSHYALNKAAIDASIGFQQNIRREYNHPSAPQQAGLFVRLNTINYGIRYSLAPLGSIELTVGINGMYQDNKSKAATDFPVPDYHLLDAGSYVYGKWKHSRLSISAGVRYDTRVLTGNDFYVGTDAATGFGKQVSVPVSAGAVPQFAAFNKTFSGTSMSLGAAYQLTGNISLKANMARGYRSPNITEFAANGLDPGAHIIYLGNRAFVPEFSLQEDIGLLAGYKIVTASLSLFNNHIQQYIYLTQLADAQGNSLQDAQGNKTFQYQQGSAHLYGLEASLDIRPPFLHGFSFNNSIAVTRGINKIAEYRDKQTKGEYLPLIPPLKWLSAVLKEIHTSSAIFGLVTIGADMEYNAAQQRFLELFNTETATPSSMLINFSAATQIKYGKAGIRLQFQVNNTFDTVYQGHLSRLKYFEYYASSPNGHRGMYNAGRSFCGKIIIDF